MPVLLLLVLSPVCAEYLVGYDTTTGNPLELLGGLIIFVPLYGAPAVLIREIARRGGVRWPGLLALALAAGILQAGVIDQSLFSTSYRDIPDWADTVLPTWIPWLGLGAHPALNFLGGHTVLSFAVPIAVCEAAWPYRSRTPWLGWMGLSVMALLYAAAAALVLDDHLRHETDHASAAQIAGSLVAVALLVTFAFTRGRHVATPAARRVPAAGWLLALGIAVGLIHDLTPPTWPGLGVAVAALASGGAAVTVLARSERWTFAHVAALCTGLLLARAGIGFLATPIGDVPAVAKYAHNTVAVLGSALLGGWAYRRAQASGASWWIRAGSTPRS